MPALDSLLEITAADRRVESGVQQVMGGGGSRAIDAAKQIEARALKTRFGPFLDIKRPPFQLWPRDLYVPTQSDPRAHWPFGSPGTRNVYALDWTIAAIGWAQASVTDGTLLAVATSPTVSGAVDDKAEAGLGILFTGTHTLSRIRLKPELLLIGRHAWSVNADPVVVVTTRAVGSVYVGAFKQDPVSGGFEAIANSPWRRHQVFNDAHQGLGASAMVVEQLQLGGDAAATEILVEGGRTYLLAVVAQTTLKIQTTNSSGRPVAVKNGQFDTWGSTSGIVREIWLEETIFVQ